MYLLAETKTLVALLGNRQLDALALGKADPGLGGLANDKDVREASGEGAVAAVLQVDNVEASRVALTVDNGADTTHIVPSSDHGNVADLELDKGLDLAGLNVDTDRVVRADQRVRVADGASVVGDNEGDPLGTDLHLADLAQLVLGLLLGNAVDDKAALDVEQETEGLAGLLDLNHVHEAGREVGVGANLTVDLDEALHDDAGDLALVQGILQAVTQKNDQGQALTELVGSRRGTRSLHTQIQY